MSESEDGDLASDEEAWPIDAATDDEDLADEPTLPCVGAALWSWLPEEVLRLFAKSSSVTVLLVLAALDRRTYRAAEPRHSRVTRLTRSPFFLGKQLLHGASPQAAASIAYEPFIPTDAIYLPQQVVRSRAIDLSICPVCGHKIPEGQSFCERCGKELFDERVGRQTRVQVGGPFSREDCESFASALMRANVLEHITIFSLSFAPDGAIDPLLDAWAGGAMIMLDRVELRQSVHTTRGLQALGDAIQKGALPAVTQLSLPQNELSSLSVEPLLRISSHLNQLKHLELHDNAQLWVDAGAFSLPEQPALQELRATLDGRGIQLHLDRAMSKC